MMCTLSESYCLVWCTWMCVCAMSVRVRQIKMKGKNKKNADRKLHNSFWNKVNNSIIFCTATSTKDSRVIVYCRVAKTLPRPAPPISTGRRLHWSNLNLNSQKWHSLLVGADDNHDGNYLIKKMMAAVCHAMSWCWLVLRCIVLCFGVSHRHITTHHITPHALHHLNASRTANSWNNIQKEHKKHFQPIRLNSSLSSNKFSQCRNSTFHQSLSYHSFLFLCIRSTCHLTLHMGCHSGFCRGRSSWALW